MTTCEHDYDGMCWGSVLGCHRRCVKCGAMIGLGLHCAGSQRQSKGDE